MLRTLILGHVSILKTICMLGNREYASEVERKTKKATKKKTKVRGADICGEVGSLVYRNPLCRFVFTVWSFLGFPTICRDACQ